MKDIAFNPKVISQHLDKLSICGEDKASRGFGPSLVKSVNTLDVGLSEYRKNLLDDKFYRLTNHLFGNISVTKGSGLHIYCDVTQNLDYGQIQWGNLTRLDIAGNRQQDFLSI